jgi:hypothetical protein
MLLTDIENAVRQDLFDPAGASQRWATSDIDRAIDKAVDRYTEYYPNIAWADMASEAYQRTYPYPTSWNVSYPVLWIERVLFPLQVYGSYFTPPSSGMSGAAAAGAGLSIGAYQYAVTFLSQGGETTPSPVANVTTTNGNQKVNLSAIPVGPASPNNPGIATNTVIGRNIYRTLVGGSTLSLLATIGDNTTTSLSDTTADSALSGKPNPPTVNTSGVMYYPPRERAFSEYSNLYDSSLSLAAGGNLGTMGTVGTQAGQTGTLTPTFTLQLTQAEVPQDNTWVMRVFYATKQQLDSNGSTIPEVHRDIIVLGACAYAMEAYQVPTNDNFEFQDGGLRDHVDDTSIPTSWATAAKNRMDQFLSRLEEIKRQRDYASSTRVHWGDIAFRYYRL